jgi:hypothetical protein
VGVAARALVLPLLCAAPAALAAQAGQLRTARLTAEVDGDGARVEAVYRVAVPPGAREVPLRGLAVFGTRLEAVRAVVGGVEVPVDLDAARAPLLTGAVPLGPLAPGDSVLSLALAYRVAGAVERDGGRFSVALPVLFVDWRPADAPADGFVAETGFPADHRVVESFPTVPRGYREEGGRARYRLALQVVPTFVSYRGSVGRAPRVGPEVAIDVAAVALLLALGGASWVALRREVDVRRRG